MIVTPRRGGSSRSVLLEVTQGIDLSQAHRHEIEAVTLGATGALRLRASHMVALSFRRPRGSIDPKKGGDRDRLKVKLHCNPTPKRLSQRQRIALKHVERNSERNTRLCH